ncbi:hypothetical protein [Jeotgalicoccus sp. ATCC 8456]|uniref:hypothetical protein n=1 Tax=Jeotgalicoccus sp. ATCC 8456 TaxID=946435 RepID=UPI0018E5E663|nr:hypothetical protein [Jeotgalicoccus sp. ATCC 8456]QQD84980.1 hypothetical protein JEM45_10345 [Jeotgalicoccus sp. ATCC 8456]
MELQLQLYFYHKEIEQSPEYVFNVLNDDQKIIDRVQKLTAITYNSDVTNQRSVGTEGILVYNEANINTEVIFYTDNRRLEFESYVPAGRLWTMVNIVPVEGRSELTISTKLITDSPVSFALYALKIPRVKKQFNDIVGRLEAGE